MREPPSELDRFLKKLVRRGEQKGQSLHLEVIPPRGARYGELSHPLPLPLQNTLFSQGVSKLYLHQAQAIEAVRGGKHALIVTATASGKSLAYQLPALERVLEDPSARALFLFPIKALEQDQLRSLEHLIPWGFEVRTAIIDGDTAPSRRAQLREAPPHILITNPDFLHLSLLPNHEAWKELFTNLRYVVLDELHTYRGIFGSHIAHVLRRLRRVASHYGASPQFIATSATIANPLELAKTLTGLSFALIEEDGAPQRGRRFLLLGPRESPYTAATDLLLTCVRHGLKTIAFAKARKIAELIYMWAKQGDPRLAEEIKPYRAGYLPKERREIEQGLFLEKLSGVVATSALELGIDVGGLDACILVGYPGSISSTWQRGGRAGRGKREALIALIALPDALDQYFLRHPKDFFARRFEAAIADPHNPEILAAHLTCAADELPLKLGEGDLYGVEHLNLVEALAREGKLTLSADGREWYARRRRPHREVNVRSIGEGYAILDPSGRSVGTLDGMRALHECHEGAVYLHRGRQYEVLQLDLEKRKVVAHPVEVDYYTQALSDKETEILHTERSRIVGAFTSSFGRLKVTEQVTGYEKRRIFGQEKIGSYPLDLPPRVFETKGLWFEVPEGLRDLILKQGLHFMGGIHALEHAMIALFPLYALCDRADVGGISYPFHPQVGRATIFIYDGYPGGIGLASRGYEVLEELLCKTLQLLKECPCEEGCPSCVHSPKCGSGNKPLDKGAALLIAEGLLGQLQWEASPPIRPALLGVEQAKRSGEEHRKVLVLDVETQRSAEEVGGWEHRDRMGLAAAVTYDLHAGRYRIYTEERVGELLADLRSADLVIGFNLNRFDWGVLKGYSDFDLSSIPTLDILECVERQLGFRLSLNHLAQETLHESKVADGLQSLRWFKAGELQKVVEYCKADVALTLKLYEFGLKNGYLLYKDHRGRSVRLPVDFGK